MAFTHSGSTLNDSSGDDRIDGVLGRSHWTSSKIFYSATDDADDYESDYLSDSDGDGVSAQDQGYSALSRKQVAAMQAALDKDESGKLPGSGGFTVEGFTNLKLKYAGFGSGEAEIRVANSTDNEDAYAFAPSGSLRGGDTWFGKAGDKPTAGNKDYFFVLHELGHALGLKHGHQDVAFDRIPAKFDSPEFSVMTFRNYIDGPIDAGVEEKWGHPQSYMMLDIAALQHMYGADYKTNSGDTVYSWDPSSGNTWIDGDLAIEPGANRIFATIWDGGGKDIYDLSAYEEGVEIDLRPGQASSFSDDQLAFLGGGPNDGYARGNIFNALLHNENTKSLIENAKGGQGDDTITGNDTDNRLVGGKGADTLEGRKGGDVLIGGKGSDVFLFGSLKASQIGDEDVIEAGGGARAFQGAGSSKGDKIDLSHMDANSTISGNQDFELDDSRDIGTIWLRDKNEKTFVEGDVDGDSRADFRIKIVDGDVLASDYIVDNFIF